MQIGNKKSIVVSDKDMMRKSNELSMAKLSHGLSLNQTQLLAFAIFVTQKNEETRFNKSDFEERFEIGKYNAKYAREDIKKLQPLYYEVDRFAKQNFYEIVNIFQEIKYDDGVFSFVWSEKIMPHILDLKERYVLTDLSITSKFRSSFSWILYDYIRGNYGRWHAPVSKAFLMQLFGVEDKKSYITNTGAFKKMVLDIAIKELNEHTELNVCYKEEKKGKTIVGFDLRWTVGNKISKATDEQLKELNSIYDLISNFEDEMKYINLYNHELREEAIKLFRKLVANKTLINDSESLTKEAAKKLIDTLNNYINELELLVSRDTLLREKELKEKEKTDKKPHFYDWLKE